MGTYVLVHGALGGGWQFNRVAQRLRRNGHQVFTPTLTGVGERAHLASPEVGLDTHVRDVTATFDYEGLTGAVLVGSDYGGVVVTAAAEELVGRLSRLVYVAGLLPEDGHSTLDLLPPAARETLRTLARDHDGWRVPGGEQLLNLWGIADPEHRSRTLARTTPFPLRCWEQAVRLPSEAAAMVPREYVELAETNPAIFGPPAARALAEGWGYHRIPADHAAWVARPDVLAGVLHLCAADPDWPEEPPLRSPPRLPAPHHEPADSRKVHR